MTMVSLRISAAALPKGAGSLRAEVRAFLASELEQGSFLTRCNNWLGGIDPVFSRKLGERGWLGMTWPRGYGGHDRNPLERFVVTEELLAAGAPVAAHWVSDRQVGPTLLRFGSEEQKQDYLPGIARGECYFCIGMSEPDSGSDLASVRTRAKPAPGGWVVNGTKLWTSVAHIAHAMIALVRTSPVGEDRHAGLSQVIIDLSSEGVTVNPIMGLDGNHHFNEVVLQDVFVPESAVVGGVGDGWHQVTTELAYERSGPERLMSTLPLLLAWHRRLRKGGVDDSSASEDALGRIIARTWALRQMSLAVAAALTAGRVPAVEAAMVKDLGAQLEHEIIDVVRTQVECVPDPRSADELSRLLAEAVLHSPAFTLRGGTTEILRGIVTRGLGIR
jgi:acyl-CoA dehydrogenase